MPKSKQRWQDTLRERLSLHNRSKEELIHMLKMERQAGRLARQPVVARTMARIEHENDLLHARMTYWRERAGVLEQGIVTALASPSIANTQAADALKHILTEAQEAELQWKNEFSSLIG